MSSNTGSHESSWLSFLESDICEIWRGTFVGPLRQVLEQVHPTLTAQDEALSTVEMLILQLLGMLCTRPSPHSISDVEERVRTNLPTPIDKWALDDAREALDRFRKRSSLLVLPVDRVHHTLQKVFQFKLDIQVSVYIVAVLEYISADLLKLTGNYVRNIHHGQITCQDIRVAMCADKVLSDMFSHLNEEETETPSEVVDNCTYSTVVKDFIYDEKQHLRNLNMITKVFLDEIANVVPFGEVEELHKMVQNLNDIMDLTFTLVAKLEDILEMSDEKQPPLLGYALEELAEEEEFDVYARYAKDIVETNCPNKLIELLSSRNALNVLPFAGQGFKEAVKYYLPKLLHYPIWHCFAYFEYIQVLQELSPSRSDVDILQQVEGLLKPLEAEMCKLVFPLHKTEKEYGTRLHAKARHIATVEKLEEFSKSTDSIEYKQIQQCATELLREDVITVMLSNKRTLQRRATLFDGILILSKHKRSVSVTAQGGGCILPSEYKIKASYYIRKVEIKDRDDTDDVKNALEIVPRDDQPVLLILNNYEEKCNWMSDLVMLNTRCMLDRSLNSVLEDEERKSPIRMPPVELYRFAEPDGPSNIVFEDRYSGSYFVKGGTLLKMIERLTYHIFTDALFVRTFLITYRTFTTPQEFLSLLIERFNVPDALVAFEIADGNSLTTKEKEDVKRYKKQFQQPIQFRVLNILKHWVDNYYDDLESEPELIIRMFKFLQTIGERSMKKWADGILKILKRKHDPIESSREVTFTFTTQPPPIEYHLKCPEEEWTLLTLHPVEVARQLTLLEFDMYRAVKSSELVGSVWTKERKEETSPNVIKIMRHTTNFTLWLEKSVVEAKNLEERTAIVTRMLEIMTVFLELNSFNGAFAIFSAMGSACLFRLKHTFQGCPSRLQKALNEVRELCDNHFRKYGEKLRSVNSPCVPFFGSLLTKIMHIEEGNPDMLSVGKDLINMSKRRRVAEVTLEIMQFQDQPYCLSVEPGMRKFFENLNPFGDMAESEAFTYLFQQSLEIEPRDSKHPTKFARQWPDVKLSSPGIKPRGTGNSIMSHFSLNGGSSAKHGKDGKDDEDNGHGITLGFLCQTLGRNSGIRSSVGGESHFSSVFSRAKALSIFSPIFISTEMPKEKTNEQGPPLPPRNKRNSRASSPSHAPQIDNRVVSTSRNSAPPPLPPRRDSLHSRPNFNDISQNSSAGGSAGPSWFPLQPAPSGLAGQPGPPWLAVPVLHSALSGQSGSSGLAVKPGSSWLAGQSGQAGPSGSSGLSDPTVSSIDEQMANAIARMSDSNIDSNGIPPSFDMHSYHQGNNYSNAFNVGSPFQLNPDNIPIFIPKHSDLMDANHSFDDNDDDNNIEFNNSGQNKPKNQNNDNTIKLNNDTVSSTVSEDLTRPLVVKSFFVSKLVRPIFQFNTSSLPEED